MAFCAYCGREKTTSMIAGRHLCDLVVLEDGREVHADRLLPGRDLEGARVIERNITEEMRNLMRKGII